VTIATDPVKKHPSPQTIRLRISCNRPLLALNLLITPANFMLGEHSAAAMVD